MPLGRLFIQETIHKFELGAGVRRVRWGVVFLTTLLFLVGYNWRAYKNLNTQEAMDSAQLARNIAEGKGYTTRFIRPFSIYLLTNHTQGRFASEAAAKDPAQLKVRHPDLANPPVYPVILAGLMKILPFTYDIPDLASKKATSQFRHYFWSKDGRFWWFPPDFLLALFNQLLFLAVVALTYALARRLFDAPVARLSAFLLLGTEMLWRFSVSGLSTMLLLVLFMGLVWCLSLLEQGARASKWGTRTPWLLAGAAGLIVGLGALTRYSFGWLIIPAGVFVLLFSGPRRVVNTLLVLAVFAAVLTPWIARNYHLSGAPFGTATFAIMESTPAFPEFQLERSLQPRLGNYNIGMFWYKLFSNGRAIVASEFPKLGGSWVSAFFLVGLLLAFKNPGISRLRYFLLFCLPVLAVAQALGRTQLSDDVPDINSENLLVLAVPLVMVFGASLFFVLLDQIELPIRQLRYAIVGAFGAVVCLPMILVFLPPKTYPIAYPPYYPPIIQQVGNWMNESELMMSDVPWAVAWYGRRQCIWLTLDSQQQFFAVSDYLKPVQALYLTQRTTDCRLISQWLRPTDWSWGSLVLASVVRLEVAPNFPLRHAPDAFPRPEQIFLTDWPRWRKPGL